MSLFSSLKMAVHWISIERNWKREVICSSCALDSDDNCYNIPKYYLYEKMNFKNGSRVLRSHSS